MESIVEVARAALPGDVVDRLSSWLGESPTATRRGVEAALPMSALALARHAESEGRAEELLQGLEQGTYPHVGPDQLDQLARDPSAADKLVRSSDGVLQRLFGSKREAITEGLAAHSGLNRGAASKVLGLLTPLVLGIVGQKVRSGNLDARGLSRYLGEQGQLAAGMLPGPLATLIGGAPAISGSAPPRVTERYAGGPRAEIDRRARAPERRSSGLTWLPWLLAAAGIIALVAFALKKPQRFQTMSRPAPDEAARAPERPQAPEAAAPAVETLSPATGAGALSRYLAGGDAVPRRFLVEGFEFQSGLATIPSSRTLDEVASTLLAHPTARIRVEGHTDATGNPSANESLSRARAEAVKSYLVQRGVTADRIDAAGLGSSQALASNDTPEGRARNRRTEIIVVQR